MRRGNRVKRSGSDGRPSRRFRATPSAACTPAPGYPIRRRIMLATALASLVGWRLRQLGYHGIRDHIDWITGRIGAPPLSGNPDSVLAE